MVVVYTLFSLALESWCRGGAARVEHPRSSWKLTTFGDNIWGRAEYCFESPVSEERTHFTEFCGELGEFCEKLGEFAFGHNRRGANSLSSLPETRRALTNSLSSVFETVLPETLFGPFPKHVRARGFQASWK